VRTRAVAANSRRCRMHKEFVSKERLCARLSSQFASLTSQLDRAVADGSVRKEEATRLGSELALMTAKCRQVERNMRTQRSQ
jgi:ribosomal protein S20